MEPLKKRCYQGVLVKAWQLNHWEGLPGLQSEFKASLGNLVRPCIKIRDKNVLG